MVVLITGVVNDVTPVPPASAVPPLAALYQSIVSPAPTVAVSVTVPVPHLVNGPAPATGCVTDRYSQTKTEAEASVFAPPLRGKGRAALE